MLEDNKSLIRRFVDEMLNKGNAGIIDQVIAPDFIDHGALPIRVRVRKVSGAPWRRFIGR